MEQASSQTATLVSSHSEPELTAQIMDSTPAKTINQRFRELRGITQEVGLPMLSSLEEVHQKIDQIIAWTKAHPVEDHIYAFPDTPKEERRLRLCGDLEGVNACVAGSAALHCILQVINPMVQRNWTPGDSDLFFLGQEKASRTLELNIDATGVTEKTIEELLMNFDLPVCRVARKLGKGWWISAQCLSAIFTHRQNLPIYLKEKKSFEETLRPYAHFEDSSISVEQALHHYYQRFALRVKKYQQRGFGVNWVESDLVIPWVKNHFSYADFMLSN